MVEQPALLHVCVLGISCEQGKGSEAELIDVCVAKFCDTVFVAEVRVDCSPICLYLTLVSQGKVPSTPGGFKA